MGQKVSPKSERHGWGPDTISMWDSTSSVLGALHSQYKGTPSTSVLSVSYQYWGL